MQCYLQPQENLSVVEVGGDKFRIDQNLVPTPVYLTEASVLQKKRNSKLSSLILSEKISSNYVDLVRIWQKNCPTQWIVSALLS